MVQYNKNIKNKKKGFTLVELMVVLAITAILAALVGGGLIAYTRLARFEKNEANARTLFQAAQISLTRMDTAGELDAFCADVEDQGKAGTHFTEDVVITDAAGNEVRRRTASELNNGIYALYYDKTDGTGQNELVRRLLDDYIYDDSMFNAAICVEIDRASGQVYSVFYDTNSDKLRFAADGVADATDITDRSYDHRRNDSLVGYYSAEDRVNVVELQQTKLKVKNPRLSNGETLTLSWGGNSNLADMDTVYTAVAYQAEKNGLTGYKIADESKPLFSIEIKRPNTEQQVLAELETTVCTYSADGTRTVTKRTLRYPLSYNKGNFVLTLDAMADASLLRTCEKDTSTADNDLYSITRLLAEPENIIIRLQAAPRDEYADSYTASKSEGESYSSAHTSLYAGSQVTLFSQRGKIVSVYVSGGAVSSDGDAVVVMGPASAATFHKLTGGVENFSIQKNRQTIGLSGIKPSAPDLRAGKRQPQLQGPGKAHRFGT